MSGAIHLSPICIYGIDRNNVNVIDMTLLVLRIYDTANFWVGQE